MISEPDDFECSICLSYVCVCKLWIIQNADANDDDDDDANNDDEEE